jgi:hypothetical protein
MPITPLSPPSLIHVIDIACFSVTTTGLAAEKGELIHGVVAKIPQHFYL